MGHLFDESELLGRVDNDVSFLGETVEMLASDGRALMADVHKALAAADAAAIGRSGHALKGMISNFCSASTQQAALEVERLGKSGNLASAPQAVQSLEQNLEALIVELQQFVQART